MATELADGVWRIACKGVNVYLRADDEVVLVDAGTPLDAGTIRSGVTDAGQDLGDVDRVLVTHFDLDHVGALWRLDDALDATVHMPDPDASYLTRTASPPWNQKGTMQRALRPFTRPPDLPVEVVADGDEVAGLTAHRTPGHTPGHTVYADEEVGFLGDLVFGDGETYEPSPWYVSYDADRVEQSIRELAGTDPEFAVGCQGHGDPLPTGGSAALSALAERL
jgi:glyoxylase-like metal-dependent hydrolase (beta-lactamase superfamily II)